MANVREQNTYESGIYQIETTDPVIGGENGISNKQAQQLANRTHYLKAAVDALQALTASNDSNLDTLQEIVNYIKHNRTITNSKANASHNHSAAQITSGTISAARLNITDSLDTNDSTKIASAKAARALNYAILKAMPVGAIIAHAQYSTPAGFLYCNGVAVSKSAYANLFSAIGTTYGGGVSHFRIPDFRGVFLRGVDDNRELDTGRHFGSYQADAMQRLQGKVNLFAELGDGVYRNPGNFWSDAQLKYYANEQGNTTARWKNHQFDNALVARTADENRPKNVAVAYFIKY